MRILLVTIPNAGHFNILLRTARQYSAEHDFGVLLVDRKNTQPPTRDISIPVYTLAGSQQFINTPETAVISRASILLEECVGVGKEFRPDLIIYDFCAIEGRFLADILDIPAWASIPGMIGPFDNHGYRDACLASPENQLGIASLRSQFGIQIDPNHVEVISNCLHIPAARNLLWSYPSLTPADFRRNRAEAEYSFVGYLGAATSMPRNSDRSLVYISFGTEVMDNMWVRQRGVRDSIRAGMTELAGLWRDREFDVLFSAQRKRVFRNRPPGWTVQDYVDQPSVLGSATAFVTHGGSNSFHEAVLNRTPMALLPFFGDQHLVADRAAALGIGIHIGGEGPALRRQRFRASTGHELASRIDKAVTQLLENPQYQARFSSIPLECVPLFRN